MEDSENTPAPAPNTEHPTDDPSHSPESPVLAVLRSAGHPIPDTVCRVCPHALWRTTAQRHLISYCREMFMETYNSQAPATAVLITSCDGPITGRE